MDHLTTAQIEEYVAQGHLKMADGVFQSLEAHLEDCESCLDRVLHVHRMHLGLLEGDRMNKTRHPGCPEETVLQELAAAISSPETAEATAQHASRCDFCGPLLNRYLKEFSDDLEAEDAALLKQLESSKPGWQKRFVREVVGSGQDKRERSFFGRFWPALAAATAAIAVAATVVAPTLMTSDLKKADKLVADAYAYGAKRTIEMRLLAVPYADFQSVPVVKGDATSGDLESTPAPLVTAEALVKQKSENGDLSPQWSQVQGRIDLLQGSPKSIDAAVDMFEKALAKNPGNPGLKVDLATAYFEKEMRADHEHPVLVKTIDLLNDVIKNSANDKPLREAALFDLALAYEKSEMRDLAISTWQQYVDLDKTSNWNKEAQRHLDDLRNHAPPPPQQGYITRAYFLAHSSDPDVLADLEEFQDIALRIWLPPAIENPSSQSGRAAAELAQLLKKKHSDSWLQDFLSQTTPADLDASRRLAVAFTYDLNDLHHQAIRESQNAAAIFAHHHNFPGEVRARFQEIYGLQRSLASDDCVQQANELWSRLSTTSYQWLRAQVALEKATCANLNFNFETAALDVELGRTIAQRFQFPELSLRVTGFDAGIQRGQENYERAWKKAEAGLAVYWKGKCSEHNSVVQGSRPAVDVCPYSLERLYQFYSVMQQCARKLGLQHASEALLLQGIAILENSAPDDISLKATLYLRLADILSRQGDTGLAEEKAANAESLLKQISTNDPTAQLYAAVTRIELAEFKLNRGNAEAALSEIEPLQGLLSTQDDFVKLDFYTIEGDIFRQLGKFENAVKSYQHGVEEAETSLSDPKNTRDQLNWRFGTGRVYRGLTRSLLALGRQHDALAVWEQFQSQSLANTTNSPADGKKLEPVYATLPSVAQPHLIYGSFEDGLQIWLLKGSQLQSKWIPLKRDDLQREVREFAKECSDPSLTLDKAQTLYAMILQPVASDLPPASTVSVELDEPMWGLTIEALQNNNGRYFADEHPVVYTPGLLAEDSLRQPIPLSGRGPMLLVDASQAVAGAPLPGHWDEVAAVKQAFPNTKTLGPSEVSPNEVRQALAQSREFHFSGHGKHEGTGAALMIGAESSLGAKDFAPGRLQHLQLAVLSACSSASARNGAFDQSNLVRSFLAGGVPAVIASRWDVDSRSTAHFMQSFYDRLHNGEPVAEALQYAQAEMRTLNNHPYYWAAFTLTGRVN